MHFTRLILTNIRSYESSDISFSQGSTLLSGDIGSGKSTILQSIEFALFGSGRGQLAAQSLLRNGAKNGSVTLYFSLKGVSYFITRTLLRTKTSVSQQTGVFGQQHGTEFVTIELSATELNSKMAKLLGYDTQKNPALLYKYTVYTSQERMKEILFEDVSSRLQTLRVIFGVEKFQVVIANLELVRKALRYDMIQLAERCADLSELETEKEAIETQNTELHSDITQMQTQKAILEKHYSELVTKQDTLTQEYQRMNAILVRYEEKTTQKSQLHKELTRLDSERQTLTQKIADLAQLQKPNCVPKDALYEELQTVTARLSEYRSLVERKTQLTAQFQRWSTDAAQLEIVTKTKETTLAKLAQIAQNITKLTTQQQLSSHTELVEAEQHLRAKLTRTQTQQSELDTQLTTLHLDTCPTCKQSITQSHKQQLQDERAAQQKSYAHIIAQLQQRLAEVTKNIAAAKETEALVQKLGIQQIQLQSQLESVEAQCSALSNSMIELRQVKTDLAECERLLSEVNIDSVQSRKSELDAQLLHAKKQEDALKAFEQAIAQKPVFESQLMEIALSQKRLQDQQRELETFLSQPKPDVADIVKSLATLKQDLTQLDAQKSTLVTQLAAQSAKRENNLAQLRVLTLRITQKKSAKSELARITKSRDWIKRTLIPLYQSLEQIVLSQAYQLANTIFLRWFTILIEDESLQARLDETFTPIIVQDGYDMDLSYLSGGEKTAVALAYRLALNHVVNDIAAALETKGILILDEPTDGFSAQQLERMGEVLRQLQLEQILLVSHEQQMESYAQHVLKVTKSQGLSELLS